jgi:Flp pilus assembly protein TadG
LRAGEQGGALVEFALVLPMMLVVIFGMATFGIAFNRYMELTQAVNVGAEQLAIARGNTTDPCALVYKAVTQVSPYLNGSQMTFNFVLNTTSYGPYTGGSANVTCSSASTSTGAAGNLIQLDPVTVNVSYPCSVLSINFGNMVHFIPVPSCNLHAQITEISQ